MYVECFSPLLECSSHFLSALQQNRAQPRLLELFYDKESIKFPTNYEICPGLHANAKIAILAKNRKNRRTPKKCRIFAILTIFAQIAKNRKNRRTLKT